LIILKASQLGGGGGGSAVRDFVHAVLVIESFIKHCTL
jgi:hypothetical protein